MKTIISSLLIIGAIGFSSISHAEWNYSYNSFAKKWIVSDGKSSIQMKTEKGAKKTAKRLNKNDKKLAKKNDGVRDDGSGNCDNPLIQC